MALTENPLFPADKVAAMFAAHTEYARLKAELFTPIVKTTSGKMNTLNGDSARKWLPFVKENPDWVTNKLKLPDFMKALDADELVALIENIEAKEQGTTKANRDIVSSDLRFFWTTAETFYDEAALEDSEIKEKYKSLPSISPQRQSDAQVEQAFNKLTEKRNKKKSTTPTSATQ